MLGVDHGGHRADERVDVPVVETAAQRRRRIAPSTIGLDAVQGRPDLVSPASGLAKWASTEAREQGAASGQSFSA
ncbi:hypothetical protein [Agromyces bauzanensis]|uniref:hypothetical protein n=1 Tax=Agromyces bauzanensis TaxID=1308924 RepID=UPI00166F18F3|nr:hypothetical protein [Agromyces bauzanensis]